MGTWAKPFTVAFTSGLTRFVLDYAGSLPLGFINKADYFKNREKAREKAKAVGEFGVRLTSLNFSTRLFETLGGMGILKLLLDSGMPDWLALLLNGKPMIPVSFIVDSTLYGVLIRKESWGVAFNTTKDTSIEVIKGMPRYLSCASDFIAGYMIKAVNSICPYKNHLK